MNVWTPQKIDKALTMLRSGRWKSPADVARALRVSDGALRCAMARHGHPSPAVIMTGAEPADEYENEETVVLAGDPIADLDPLSEHLRKQDESKSKANEKRLLEELAQAHERQRVLDTFSDAEPPRIVRREKTSGLREATALVLASDWHYEETVTAEQTAGRNEYNTTIADRRIGRFFEGIHWLLGFHRQAFKIRDLLLWLGGDQMTGYIHEELVEHNGLSPTEAVFRLEQRIADGILSLLEDRELVRVVVVCSHGNHGRTTQKSRVSTGAKNSFEWLMFSQLARRFATEPRVHFEVTQSGHQYAEVYGETIHFTHGDEIKFQGGVGGIAVPLMRQLARWDQVRPSRLHCVGHFHQRRSFRTAMVNGSLIGLSAYGMRFGWEPPEQSFALLDSKRWLCCETPIWVEP